MRRPIVHLCYAGTSGASRAAMNIAHGSVHPSRHAYVLFGTPPMRADYGPELTATGCRWSYVPKRRGLDADWWDAPPPKIDPSRPLRIGMVGVLADYKDHPTLLRAARRLADGGIVLTVDIVGTGPMAAPLRARRPNWGWPRSWSSTGT